MKTFIDIIITESFEGATKALAISMGFLFGMTALLLSLSIVALK